MKYAPAARTTTSASIRSPAAVTTPVGTRPVQRQPVDRRVGEHAQVRPERAASRYAKAAFQRVPSTTFDGSVARADRLRGIVGVVEQREARLARRLEERDVERRGLGRVGGTTRSMSRARGR